MASDFTRQWSRMSVMSVMSSSPIQWTKRRAHRLAAEIRAGQVYVNTYGAGGGVELPFGGFKKSGYGREKDHEALDTFSATKTVVVRL